MYCGEKIPTMLIRKTPTLPQVGLSGSSAIVVAAFRSLLKFHNLTIADLGISKTGTTNT